MDASRAAAGVLPSSDRSGGTRSIALTRPAAAHAAALGCAVVLWVVSLSATDVRRMSDFGLVSVLPLSYYVALGLLTLSFCLAVHAGPRHWALPAAHLALLLAMLHGTPAILYDTLRYSWAWKHVGIVDYIQRHGSVDPTIGQLSAYHNWPGFFSFIAMIVQAGGWRSALPFAPWAPLLDNALFAAAVLFICRSLTTDRRLSWLAAWLFCTLNWVGQDYFSPQATSYFIYLVVVGACLRWLRPAGAPDSRAFGWLGRLGPRARDLVRRSLLEGTGPVGVRNLPALVAVAIVCCAAVVPTHQLTPFMLIVALAVLALAGLCAARALPLLVAVLTATWVVYMSVGFLKGNLYWIVASIGSLNIGGSTLANLAKASPDQVVVAETARRLTLLVGALAAAGLVRRVRAGHADLAPALLAGAPVAMVWGNAYGGEVLFRVYFFSLPFLAFLAAGLVFPKAASGTRPALAIAVPAVCGVLLAGMLVAYYGKERMFRFSHDEVRAATYLYSHAQPGSILIAATDNYPWAFRNYERYSYVSLGNDEPAGVRRSVLADPLGEVTRLVGAAPARRAYVIITRSQRADIEMNGLLPSGSVDRIERAVQRSPEAHEVYRGPDAQVFEVGGGVSS